MTPGEHNGYGTGFYCPADGCLSEDAYVDYATDNEGYFTAFLCTCVSCGEEWISPRANYGF